MRIFFAERVKRSLYDLCACRMSIHFADKVFYIINYVAGYFAELLPGKGILFNWPENNSAAFIPVKRMMKRVINPKFGLVVWSYQRRSKTINHPLSIGQHIFKTNIHIPFAVFAIFSLDNEIFHTI